MEVTEALRTSILEPHDHLQINQVRALGRSVHATQITRFGRNAGGQVGGRRSTISADIAPVLATIVIAAGDRDPARQARAGCLPK